MFLSSTFVKRRLPTALLVTILLLNLFRPLLAFSVDDIGDAVNILDRRQLYSVNDPSVQPPCMARRLGVRPFRFAPGFVSDHPSPQSLNDAYAAVKIVHHCPKVENVLDFHLRVQRPLTNDCNAARRDATRSARQMATRPRGRRAHLVHDVYDQRLFRASTFLALMRNKKLTFYGDSVGRQIFLDLVAELLPHQTAFSYLSKNRTHVHHVNTTQTNVLPDIHRLFSKREYAAYNTSIVYYDDGYANRFTMHVRSIAPHAWDDELLTSDVIVVGIGAWFKPHFFPVLSPDDYYDDMRQKFRYLNNSLWTARAILQQRNPRARVIWRLNGHVGMIDELPHIGRHRNETFDTTPLGFFRHNQGELWSNFSYGAVWPMVYNRLYPPVAQFYGDTVLDYWHISVRHLSWVDDLVDTAKRALARRNEATEAVHVGNASAEDVLLHADVNRFDPLLTPQRVAELERFLKAPPPIHGKPTPNATVGALSFFPAMSDSLHYCPGGIPRAGVFALHEQLVDLFAPPRGRRNPATPPPLHRRVDKVRW